METRKITIEADGRISVPASVQMSAFEIAVLFGVCVQTVNAHIRAVLKSEVVRADISCPATVSGNILMPDLHGPDMITALAFRIRSPKAGMFREWVMRRISAGSDPLLPAFLVRLPDRTWLN